MDYADIIARIAAAINDDEVAAITGPVGNGILNDMVAELGEGYQFAGILTPTSNPVRTDARLWALAMTPGKYYNLDGRVLADGQVAVFMWGGGWSSVVLSVTTAEAVRELLSQFMDATTADAEVDLKADELTPVVPPMVTGSARGILGRSAAARFLYRQTSSGSGAAWLRSIHGRTVSYNQLVRNGDFSDGTTGWVAAAGVSFSVSGKIATITAAQSNVRAVGREIALIQNHKYFGAATIKSSDNNAKQFDIAGVVFGTTSGTTRQRVAAVVTWSPGSGNWYLGVRDLAASDFQPFTVEEVVLVDLTQAGLDTIITTPEQFDAWQMEQFGHKGYLGYTPGKLVNVNPTGVLTTGRNVWDEEWEVGGISNVDGTNNDSVTSSFRSKNYIHCLPGNYYFHSGTNDIFGLRFYDANKNYVSYAIIQDTRTYTIPAGVYYLRFVDISRTVYNHDICINVSDPAFNGQYVPYNGHTLPLDFTEHFPTGMNGVNGIYDEVVSDENGKFTDGDKRFGIVDLGTLNWAYHAATQVFFVIARIAGMKAAAVSVCSKYPTKTTSPGGTNDGELSTQTYFGAGQPFVKDSSFGTDAAAFKTAMSGVPLVFELATPQHVTFADPSDAVYPVTEGGTEQVLPVNGSEPTTIAPDFQMQAPLRRGYDTPTDATFDNFLEALGQHLGKTIAKEWDAETQTYQFDIL